MVVWGIWHFHLQSKQQKKQGESMRGGHLKVVAKAEFQEKQGGDSGYPVGYLLCGMSLRILHLHSKSETQENKQD